MGNARIAAAIENHGAKGSVDGIVGVVAAAIIIGKSQQALAAVAEVAAAVCAGIGAAVLSDLNRADEDWFIEADSFGAGEAEDIGNLLGVVGCAARSNPLAHIGQSQNGHNAENGDYNQEFD